MTSPKNTDVSCRKEREKNRTDSLMADWSIAEFRKDDMTPTRVSVAANWLCNRSVIKDPGAYTEVPTVCILMLTCERSAQFVNV